MRLVPALRLPPTLHCPAPCSRHPAGTGKKSAAKPEKAAAPGRKKQYDYSNESVVFESREPGRGVSSASRKEKKNKNSAARRMDRGRAGWLRRLRRGRQSRGWSPPARAAMRRRLQPWARHAWMRRRQSLHRHAAALLSCAADWRARACSGPWPPCSSTVQRLTAATWRSTWRWASRCSGCRSLSRVRRAVGDSAGQWRRGRGAMHARPAASGSRGPQARGLLAAEPDGQRARCGLGRRDVPCSHPACLPACLTPCMTPCLTPLPCVQPWGAACL